MTISKDTSAPLIVVVGATGAQGSSVIKALAESDKPYRIRAFTRDTTKPEAQRLVEQAVELVVYTPQSATLEETRKLFEGATYVFAVTIAAVFQSKEQEIAEGKRYVDAAKAVGVRLLVWSGLLSISELSHGKYTGGDHFESKVQITQHAKDIGIPFVNVQAGAYMENYLGWIAPRKQADGSYASFGILSPTATIPLIDAHGDYGLFVRKAIEVTGLEEQEIYGHSEVITYAEIVEQWSKITGRRILYVQQSPEEFRESLKKAGFPDESARKTVDTFQAIKEFGYWGDKDLAKSLKGLSRPTHTWSEFVKTTDWSKVLN